tara:strand:+ start:1441 stop:2064 length:624 start_codon:yes stop_codon:yes gene_type:complete
MGVISCGGNLKMRTGNIYRLYRDDDLAGDRCYIGSTTIPYFCVRLCQHRKKWREGKDYSGLFQDGSDPCVEFLESYTFEAGDRDAIIHVREREQFYYDKHKGNCINLRRPRPNIADMTPQVRYQAKYDRSEKGRLIQRRAFIKTRIKNGDIKRQATHEKYSQELAKLEDRIRELKQIKINKINKIDPNTQSISSVICMQYPEDISLL